MLADSPEHAVELLDHAFNHGDIDAVLGFYESSAVVVTEPGRLARGTDELRRFFERVMRSGASAKQLRTHVIEGMEWHYSCPAGPFEQQAQIPMPHRRLSSQQQYSAGSQTGNGKSSSTIPTALQSSAQSRRLIDR